MGRPRLPLGTAGRVGVTQLPDSQWRARCNFRDWDGVTRAVARYGATEAKARRALSSAVTERIRENSSPSLDRGGSVSDLLDLWLSRMDEDAELAVGTRQQYRKVVDAYVRPALGSYSLGEINVPAVDRALRTIRQKRSHSVAKSARAVMSGAFGLAATMGALPANPVRSASKLRASSDSARSLTDVEADDLADRFRTSQLALDLDIADPVDWILGTGARIGEVLAARDDTVKHARTEAGWAGQWLIDSTIVRVTGSGLILQPNPKSASGVRLLDLPEYLPMMLERRAGERRLRGPHGVVFGSPSRRSLRDPSNMAGDLRDVLRHLYCTDCEGSGYVSVDTRKRRCRAPGDDRYGWVTFHTFRKTVATRLEAAGQTARQVADQLGHAKVSMTQDVYFGRHIANPAAAKILDR